VLDRAFARNLAERYASAQDLEFDLHAVLAGGTEATRRTVAVNGAAADADATRRTGGATQAPDDEATRRTSQTAPPAAAPDQDATRRTNGGPPAAVRPPAYAQATEPSAAAATPGTVAEAPRPRTRLRLSRIPWKFLAAAAVLFLAARELQGFAEAQGLRANLASRPRGDAPQVWSEYHGVMRGHALAHLSGLDGAVRDWMVSHADDLISRYRSDTPTLYETGWRAAEGLLAHAAAIDPGNRKVQARLEFCRAHLLRIAARDSKQADDSSSSYDEAISRFERAAHLWPGWGDPWIGLAQIYAYGKRDPERTSDALDQAKGDGYPFGERETALLGDAYRLRAERRWTGSTDAFDNDQLYRHLERVRDDCTHALEQYELVPSYAGAAGHLREVRALLAQVDARMSTLSGGGILGLFR
jgi:hypothetical protein